MFFRLAHALACLTIGRLVHYTSTYCLHGDCVNCRRVCKHCTRRCLCPCHLEAP